MEDAHTHILTMADDKKAAFFAGKAFCSLSRTATILLGTDMSILRKEQMRPLFPEVSAESIFYVNG